jgi:hypothetical protein
LVLLASARGAFELGIELARVDDLIYLKAAHIAGVDCNEYAGLHF